MMKVGAGGWNTLDAIRVSWVPHPFGVCFIKGCGFRVNFIATVDVEEKRLRLRAVQAS